MPWQKNLRILVGTCTWRCCISCVHVCVCISVCFCISLSVHDLPACAATLKNKSCSSPGLLEACPCDGYGGSVDSKCEIDDPKSGVRNKSDTSAAAVLQFSHCIVLSLQQEFGNNSCGCNTIAALIYYGREYVTRRMPCHGSAGANEPHHQRWPYLSAAPELSMLAMMCHLDVAFTTRVVLQPCAHAHSFFVFVFVFFLTKNTRKIYHNVRLVRMLRNPQCTAIVRVVACEVPVRL